MTAGRCAMKSRRTFHIARRAYGRHPALQDQYLLVQAGPNWERGIAPGYADTGDTLETDATADAQLYAELRTRLEATI